MRLLIATPSPFARKVRIALLEKALAFETVIDNPWNAGAQAAAANPLGKVPVLFLDDGRSLVDSRVIVEYLESLGRAPALLPADPALRVAHRQLEAIADGVCDAVVLIVLERSRPPTLQSGDWVRRQRSKVEAGVAALEDALAEHDWFVADDFGLADVAVGCMLGYLDVRLPEFAWRAAAPGLERFSQRIFARPSFASTVPTAQRIDPVT
jgi:glutathione S-transferase